MNHQPLVSIIIPTYNREKYIKRAIDSALNQTYKNIEIIIIDGSSNDKTKEVIKPYLSNFPIRYIRQKEIHTNYGVDRNPSGVRNQGIKIAKGKYIAILDDDDFWCNKKKLEKQVKFLEEHPDYVLIGGGAIAIDENGREYYRSLPPEKDEEIRKLMLFDCIFYHSTVMFKKDTWKAVGGLDEKLHFAEDWDFFLKLGRLGKFYNFQEYFLYYLVSKESKTSYRRRRNAEIHLKLKQKYRKEYPNFWKAYLLGLGLYIASLFPHQKWFSKMFIIPKIKNLFFGRKIYDK
jgi:glycosyltransferase domain-containing protein